MKEIPVGRVSGAAENGGLLFPIPFRARLKEVMSFSSESKPMKPNEAFPLTREN